MQWSLSNVNTKLFPGQQADEKVYLIIRQHWLMFVFRMVMWLAFVAILIAADIATNRYLPIVSQSPYAEIFNVIKTVYVMFLALGLLVLWIMYYLNVQIVTNERVVDITQTSLLHHTISELHLNRIQDVTAEVEGVFETFLDFGNVYIQTAGETERFVFYKVPNPTSVNKLILDLYEQLPNEVKMQGHVE